MATKSLYRRYRPRRFSELKGQDHIVRALRTSVAEGREGQAYLFSGPRGTGKTTTARIMAKVLNCSDPVDGEPCCECESCLSVEAGTSYDVHELDAASNNGVDAMRDLIEKASLGTPGRHKVYILDEVHMLSKGAEAALLKTLEEPPPHVVFVLATTDPQKMSDTIRSRTQHLQFHLLAPDTLEQHVRWVAEDAGLTVTDEAIEQVVAQGAGSPRDTLSFLELASNSGGGAAEVIALDDFVESMIDHDPGRALKMVAHAISRGRDPRTVTEELIGFLRNGFLSLMAPDLVQLPSQRIDALTDLAQRLGAAGLVRGIETLGEALTEMRQAPDPRVLLDVATVQLTSEQVGAADIAGLVARIQKLERRLADGVPAAPAAAPASGVTSAGSSPAVPTASDASAAQAAPAVDPSTGRARLGSRVGAPTPPTAPSPTAPTEPAADTSHPNPQSSEPPAADRADRPAGGDVAPAESVPAEPMPSSRSEQDASGSRSGGEVSSADWDSVRPRLKGMARAVYSPATYVSSAPGRVTLAAPNDAHRAKCEQHRDAVEQALGDHSGSPVTIELVVGGGGPSGGGGGTDDTGGGESANGGPGSDTVDRSAPSGARSSDAARATSSDPRVSTPQGPSPQGSSPQGSTVSGRSGAGSSVRSGRVVVGVGGSLAHDDDPSSTAIAEPPSLSVVPDVAAPGSRATDDRLPGEPGDDGRSPADGAVMQATDAPVPVLNGRAIADRARSEGPTPDPDAELQRLVDTLPDDDEVDLDDLVDAPPESVRTPIDRLADAFPGSEMVDDQY